MECVNMEPQRIINLTSDILISIRAYHISPREEEDIKNQAQNLL